MSTIGDKLLKAIDTINRNVPSLNKFFEEFDVYDGRIFEVWELQQIFGRSVTQAELTGLSEENGKKE